MTTEPTSAFLGSMISVSACGLIYVALMNRYSVLIPQIRLLQLHSSNKSTKTRELVELMLRRARMMQWTLILISLAILLFLLGVFETGVLTAFSIKTPTISPLSLFLGGIVMMIFSMVLGLIEILLSLNTLQGTPPKV